jgi:hypothetical protein
MIVIQENLFAIFPEKGSPVILEAKTFFFLGFLLLAVFPVGNLSCRLAYYSPVPINLGLLLWA